MIVNGKKGLASLKCSCVIAGGSHLSQNFNLGLGELTTTMTLTIRSAQAGPGPWQELAAVQINANMDREAFLYITI